MTRVTRFIGNNRDWPGADLVSDRNFMRQLNLVHDLKTFILEHGTSLSPTQVSSLDLVSLNRIRYSRFGRPATEAEWSLADEKAIALTQELGESCLQQFRLDRTKRYYLRLARIFLVLTGISTAFYLSYFDINLPPDKNDSVYYSVTYTVILYSVLIVWTLAQGGFGACAFLGASISSSADDAHQAATPLTSTLPESSRMSVRIIIGCSFALILGFPFSCIGLEFLRTVISGDSLDDLSRLFKSNLDKIYYPLVPFLLGFSTDLALSLLKRLTDAVSILFGVKSNGPGVGSEDRPERRIGRLPLSD
jgi:hypothetical protein